MNKKKTVIIFSVLIAAVIIVCLAMSVFNRQKLQRLQTAIQTFGIHETDDIIICDYDRYGLWNDQSLSLSTQKDFELFINENIMVPITITDESDKQPYRVISFKYVNGNQTIYGDFFISSNDETNQVLLLIYG